MKKLTNFSIVIFCLSLSISVFSKSNKEFKIVDDQVKISGQYHDFFGCKLELKKDLTFKFTWNFDLYSSWTIGKWTFSNDTIYLQVKLILDTLTWTSQNQTGFQKLDKNISFCKAYQ
jgi:hypothetical protein